MNKISSSYDISLKTMTLLPVRDIDYDTIVIIENETKYVRQTSFNLIKEACLKRDWTTYEGRRDGVIKHTNSKKKTPIPLDINIRYHHRKELKMLDPLCILKIDKHLNWAFLFIP